MPSKSDIGNFPHIAVRVLITKIIVTTAIIIITIKVNIISVIINKSNNSNNIQFMCDNTSSLHVCKNSEINAYLNMYLINRDRRDSPMGKTTLCVYVYPFYFHPRTSSTMCTHPVHACAYKYTGTNINTITHTYSHTCVSIYTLYYTYICKCKRFKSPTFGFVLDVDCEVCV